jgi:hypothetical protein
MSLATTKIIPADAFESEVLGVPVERSNDFSILNSPVDSLRLSDEFSNNDYHSRRRL